MPGKAGEEERKKQIPHPVRKRRDRVRDDRVRGWREAEDGGVNLQLPREKDAGWKPALQNGHDISCPTKKRESANREIHAA